MRPELRHPSIWKRAIALWSVLLLVVGSSWHICEMGGSQHCHPEKKAPANTWKPKCGGGLTCPCKPPQGAIYSVTGQFLTATPVSEPFEGTCLAKLMLGMPGSLAAPVELVTLVSRQASFTPSPTHSVAAPMLPQPPARGPPAVSA